MDKNFIGEMCDRGILYQCTDMKSLEIAMRNPINSYIGFDCTSDSLHIGSLIQIMVSYLHEMLFMW